MKKSLLLLFSLLIFVGNVWGGSHSLNNKTVQKYDQITYQITENCPTKILFTAKYNSATDVVSGSIRVKQYNSSDNEVGSDTYTVRHGGSSIDMTLNSSTKKIIIENTSTKQKVGLVNFGPYSIEISSASYSNTDFSIDIPDVTISKTTPGNYTGTLSINYSAICDGNITVSQLPSTSNFSISGVTLNGSVVNSTCSTGTKELTVKFSANEVGEYSDVVKFKYGNTEVPVRLFGYIQPTIDAPTSFTVKEPSYTSVKAEWTYSGSATGFRIVNDITGVYQYVDGANARNCVITGLMPGETYTFTIYPTINRAPSTKSRQSSSITTISISCKAEEKGSKKIDAVTHLWDLTGALNWDDKYTDALTTTRNQAIITFDYATTTSAATGTTFFVQESSDGTSWSKITSWSSNEKSGKGCVVLSRGVFNFRFVYSGNFGATISNIKASTTPYIEVSTDALDFGSVEVGSSATRTVNVSWCAIPGEVSSNYSEFVPNVSNVGENSCGYGNSTVTVTYTADAVGAVSRTLNIGGNEIALTATGVLPAPSKLDAVPSYNYVDLSWPAVTGANSYYLTINDGTSDRYISGITTTSYKVEGLLTSHNYSFSVRAVKGTVQSNPVNATATTKTINVPQNVTCTPDYLSATLNWTEVADRNVYDYYVIYDKDGNQVGTSETSSFQISGLQWGVNYGNYTVKVHAFNTLSESSASCNVTTKTLLAPTGVSVSNIGYDNATVTWNVADGASLYRVYLSSDNGQTYTKYGNDVMNTSTRQMQITDLVPGKKYYVKVESVLNSKETSRTDSKDFTTKTINVPQNLTCTPDYLSATLSWTEVADIDKYDYYVIYDKDGHQVGTSETSSYQINGLQWGVNYGSYTVKVHAFDTESAASAGCNVTTKTLLAPEITGKTDGFDNTVVTWNAADGATLYVMYLGTTKVGEVEATVTSYTFEDLELDSNYSIKVESKLNDKETTSAVAQDVKTGKLNASASFTISNASYTTCQGSWSAIPNATGYKVVASNGAVTIFDGHDTTSGVIAGLLPNNTYTCTVYGMYNKAVSKNGKQSNSISTLTTNCETESLGGASIDSKGGFNWDDKYSKTFTTSRNQATISFRFATNHPVLFPATGVEFYVEESADGSSWTRKSWTSTSNEGSGSVTLSRGKFKFRFVYSGNYGATISNVNAVQAVYMDVDKTNINFGNLVYGNSASATINVAYSTMVSEITTTNSNYTLSPASVGYDDCKYGTIPVEVTFNANGTAPLGEQNTLIYIGSNAINIYATVTLPVPVLSLVSTSYQSVNLSWAAIPGAERYKVNCSNGTSAWINSSDFTGTYRYSGLLQNTNYSFTVQAYGGEELTDASNTVSAKTQSLAVPTLEASNISYTSATLSWNGIEDAKGGYELINGNGNSVFVGQNVTSVNVDTLEIHKQYTYKIYSLLEDGTRSLNYGSVTFTTADLAVSASLELSNVSYNSMDATWEAVPDAQGYMIRERLNRLVLTFDANVTSTTIYGLKPGTEYEFYLYATYNEVPATDRVSASATTKSSSCPVQEVADHTFGCPDISPCGGDWNEKIYEIDTDKNAPIMGFAYAINQWATKSFEEMTKYGPHVRVEAYEGNRWVEKWRFTRSQGIYSGSAEIDNFARSTRKIRIIYKGNLDCKITGCTIAQDSYMELDKTSVAFGEYMIGTTATQTLGAAYSSQAISVVSSETDMFTASKDELGDGNCGYGDDSVIITANTSVEPGTYTAELVAGTKHLPMSITVLGLPAPTPFEVSGTAPASITLTWGDVNITETGYKVVCKQGETEIETKNLGGDVTTCTFEGLTPNVEYTFTITTMYNTIENGSATITGSTANVPAPQNFEISNIMSARADASWSTVTGATGYRLSWDNGGSEGNGSVDLDADVTNYTLTGLIPGTTYTATVTSLLGGTAYGSVDTEFTTTFVVRTSASGDEPANQQHNIEFISGELAGDGSYKAGAVIRYTTSTTSANIRFVSVNVDGIIYNTPEVEIVINSNVHIESYYVYNGIAEVVDEHGEVIYGTLTDAVNAAEEGAVINLLGDVAQDMVVSKYIKFNGNGHDIDNLYINKDGNVELTGAVTVVKDFGLEVSAARSGQFLENGGQIEVTGKAYVDKTFDASGTSKASSWYSLAVPFPVSVANGMFILANNTEKAAHAFSDINIYHYDGAVRAQTISGRPSDDAWVPVTNGYLQPGVFYLVALPKGGANTFRFYKAEGEDLITLSKNVDLYEYHAQNPIHGGWNGIGNSQLYHVGVTFNSTGYAQILDTNNKFVTVDLGESSFAVTTPMFIQSAEDATATFSFKNSGKLRSASAGSATYNLRIAREGANEFADQMFVSASSEATGSYTIGKDLAKFEVSTAYPQIYTSAYNVSLSVHEAAYNEKNIADMPLYIYVPEAGNYTLSLGKDVLDGTSLYLVKDGVEIHNFNTDGAYTLYLAKGKNTSYSLRIAGSEIEDVPTPATETVVDGAIKVYVKEHTLYIEGLAEGETYTVGNMIRSLYSGKSNGNIVRLPLDQQGIYWVKAGEKGVKVLNK